MTKPICTCLLLSILLLLLFSPRAHTQGTADPAKYAVLVGVSRLQYTPGLSLRGPRNDVPRVRQMLLDRYGFRPENVITLEGDRATRANVLAAIHDNLASKARPGDLALFYFSGHGTLIAPEPGVDMPGRLYKAFVPTDAQIIHGPRIDGSGQCPGCDGTLCRWKSVDASLIRYREVEEALRGIHTDNVVMILDSCHSGVAARAGITIRRWRDETEDGKSAARESADTASDLIGVTVLTACTAHETAKDEPFLRPSDPTAPAHATDAEVDSWYMGALTYVLLDTLRRDTAGTMTYREILEAVRARLARTEQNQTPEMEGAETRAFLAFDGPPPPPDSGKTAASTAVVTAVAGDTVTLRPAAASTLLPGSVFAAPSGAPTAVRIARAEGLTAQGYRLAGVPIVGETLAEAYHAVAPQKLRVVVRGSGTAAVADLRMRLDSAGFVQTVGEGAAADCELEVSPANAGGITVVPYRNQTALPSLSGTDPGDVFPKIGRVLENLSALQLLTDLDNPNAPFHIDVRVDGKKSEFVAIDDHITFTAHADHDCYLYLLDIDPTGKVTVLFPNKFVPSNRLLAGQEYNLPLAKVYHLRVEGPAGPELVKAIATNEPLTLDVLARDKGDFSGLGDDAGRIARDLLAQLRTAVNARSQSGLRGIVAEADKGPAPISTEGWTADTVYLKVTGKP